jgi:hypothetical protein
MQQNFYRAKYGRLQCSRVALAVALLPLTSVAHAQSKVTKGTWAFTPPRDEFSPNALLDLRYLNEKEAGESGFVRRSADGNDFVLGNGQPARFWSILSFHKNEENPEWNHHARWLAKRGVNLVRLFGDLFSDENSRLTDIRIKERDNVWRSVAAFKKEGIYTSYMPFWSHVVSSKHLKSWGIPGDEDQSPSGLLFFDKTLQSGYKSWLKQMFDTKNPYTGIRLADDPSLAIIELQNEDSLLFWTAQGIKGQQLRNLEKLYGDYLIKKYGSLDKASATWQVAGPAELGFQNGGVDDFAQGRAGLYITWFLTQPQTGYKALRLADQLQFLGETMRDFNAEMVRYLREDLGCKQLINAGNWKTADPVLLNDVERWSYTVGDVISVNRYYNGIHKGPRAGWSWDVGDTFTNESALLDPRALPLNMKQVVGHPNVVSESGWIAPGKYQTEGPFLTAAYASLTGVDNVIPQSTGSSEWQNQADGKWHQATPQSLGQFPAAALMFRNGYIKKGSPVVHEERTMADLWNRREPLIAEDKSFDPNRDTGTGGAKSNLKLEVNPLAFLVGPVQVKYGGDPEKTTVADIKPFIDEVAKTIRSNTGEINLDYGKGLCTVNTPRAQGATGFVEKFPSIKLSDVTLSSTNEYATLTVVSMDNLPISQSRKLLVQIGTIVRPTGWQEKDATFEGDDKKPVQGKQIVATGGTPFQITNVEATVTVNNSLLKTATLLDINGMPVGAVPATRAGANFTVQLPPNAMYIVLQ